MIVELPYGKTTLRVEIPDRCYAGTLEPKDDTEAPDPEGEVRRALARPIGSPPLRELVSPRQRVVILASDISRPAPSTLMLPPILDELSEAGVPDAHITVIFGLGIHRRQTSEERRGLVGSGVFDRVECIDHDIEACVEVGVTSRGNHAEVNRRVAEADFVIATGNLEYHYFAGYSGGAKALAPGVCGRATIEANHRLFVEQGARCGRIEGNPLREELEEIAAMTGVDFMLNLVLNRRKRVIRAVAGDVTLAHRAGVESIDRIYRVAIDRRADIVIVTPGGFPKDMTLYQAHKAMQNALQALKPGGILLTAAHCREGIGDEKLAGAFTDGTSLVDLAGELGRVFIQGRHIASQMARILLDHEIYLVTDMASDPRSRLFFPTFDSIEAALAAALEKKGRDAGVLVLPYGISTLPAVESAQ